VRALEDPAKKHKRLGAGTRLALHPGQPSLDVLARHLLESHTSERRQDLRVETWRENAQAKSP